MRPLLQHKILSWVALTAVQTNTREGVSCDALQVEGRPTLHQSFWAVFWPDLHCAYAQTATSEASSRNSDIIVRFSDPDVLKESIDLVNQTTFSGSFHCTDRISATISALDLEHASLDALRTREIFTSVELGQYIRSEFITFLLLRRYVMLWPWPLTLWPSPWLVYRVTRLSCDQTVRYQIWVKWNNSRIPIPILTSSSKAIPILTGIPILTHTFSQVLELVCRAQLWMSGSVRQ